MDSKPQLSGCLGFSVATTLENVSQCQGLDKSKDTAPGTSQRPSGKEKEERQFQQQPSHPHPVPDSYLLYALAHPIHSSETNKKAGPLATARTQERSKEMMFGKDKAGV